MNLQTKKILLIVLPLLIAGGGIYAMNSHNKKNGKNKGEEKPSDEKKDSAGAGGSKGSASTKTAAAQPAPGFPLKKGMPKNDLVKELQRAIGFSGKAVDGDFGSGTLTKLQSFAGLSEVADQAALDTIKRKAVGVTNLSRAADQVKKFAAGGVAIYFPKTVVLKQYIEDVNKALSPTGRQYSFTAGKTYNNKDFKVKDVTVLGNVLIQCVTGDLAGLYVADPNAITLVKS